MNRLVPCRNPSKGSSPVSTQRLRLRKSYCPECRNPSKGSSPVSTGAATKPTQAQDDMSQSLERFLAGFHGTQMFWKTLAVIGSQSLERFLAGFHGTHGDCRRQR